MEHYQDVRLNTSTVISTPNDTLASGERESTRRVTAVKRARSHGMESIGRLAGSLAHDINNLMSVILLHGESVLQELTSEDPLAESVTAMQEAAQRAVALTRKLMAFCHVHVGESEVLNLNSVIVESEELLRRVLGEDIDLELIPGPGLGNVKADPSQLNQILMNLVLNSRDAMPHGGKLTIETANVELEKSCAQVTAGPRHGSHVMMAVRDTGAGMDEETQARAFDPFFTTRGAGDGTGLGLSIIYRIVKQSNGYIELDSEPGRGTEVRIYLPSALETPQAVHITEATREERGVETILLAEDEPALREKVRDLLEAAGYRVLVSNDVDDAIQIGIEHQGPVDLLLTDVVMPKLSGPQLAIQLQAVNRQMKVLYMSGYPDPDKLNAAIASDAAFIQKPFTKQKLLRRLREVLEGR